MESGRRTERAFSAVSSCVSRSAVAESGRPSVHSKVNRRLISCVNSISLSALPSPPFLPALCCRSLGFFFSSREHARLDFQGSRGSHGLTATNCRARPEALLPLIAAAPRQSNTIPAALQAPAGPDPLSSEPTQVFPFLALTFRSSVSCIRSPAASFTGEGEERGGHESGFLQHISSTSRDEGGDSQEGDKKKERIASHRHDGQHATRGFDHHQRLHHTRGILLDDEC